MLQTRGMKASKAIRGTTMTHARSGANLPMKRAALTLTELLIVIAILAVVAAIITPVIIRAREAGEKSASASNLHSIGLATLLYADSNDSTLPHYRNSEMQLYAYDPEVTGIGLPTNSPMPGRLVESVSAYMGKSRDVWFTRADPFRGDSNPQGTVNHVYTSYLYDPIPEGHDSIESMGWPIVIRLSQLGRDGLLYVEDQWITRNGLTSYWSGQVAQGVFVDGRVESRKIGQKVAVGSRP